MAFVCKRFLTKFVLLLSCFVFFVESVSGEEFRGVWALSTWTQAGTSEMEILFDHFQDYRFNNVMFYGYNIGCANYPSTHMPWNNRSGSIGIDPGWDPLARAVQLAHERNILLHVKINCYLAWEVNNPLPEESVHPVNQNPEWIHVGRDGDMMSNQGEHLFFNPCHPDYQQALFDACVELARNYEIDGLHFDFIRYPNTQYSFDPVTLNRFWARFGKSPDDLSQHWLQWRRDQITDWIVRVKAATRRYRPDLIFGADVYHHRSSSTLSVLQDQTRWLEMHLMDFNTPMLYTTNMASFENPLMDHLEHSHGRAIVAGIAAHMMSGDANLLGQQIQVSRDHDASGIMIYKDETLFPNFIPSEMAAILKANFFQEATGTPDFPWKSPTEYNPPQFAGLNKIEPRNGMAVLRWEPAKDVSQPVTYTIYSSTDSGGQNFNMPVWATQNEEFLLEGLENGRQYYLVVRAEDNFGNEDTNVKELSVVPSENVSFILADFESEIKSVFLDPNDSPLSIGLDQTSKLSATQETVHCGISSGELNLVWTDPSQGQCFLQTGPSEPQFSDFTGWFSFWLYGNGDRTRVAAVFRDSGLERTSWITVDWNGWRQVEWFLPRTLFTSLVEADGVLTGGIFGGSFAGLLFSPGENDESNLVLDDLENRLCPDSFPPVFSGLNSIEVSGSVANLSWPMAMDANNPITYNIYSATSPESLDFDHPTDTTTQLNYNASLISPSSNFYFLVRAEDTLGNEDDNVVVLNTRGTSYRMLESFESGSSSYWNGYLQNGIIFQDPNYSGTTQGVLESSAWIIETTPVIHGNFSGQLHIEWEDASNRFCRITTHPVRPTIDDYRQTLSVWVHGDGSYTRMAAVILDNQHQGADLSEYERTPWVTIDWVGWRKLQWILPNVAWVGLWQRGTGNLEDLTAGGMFDGFLFEPGSNDSTTLLFDSLQIGSTPKRVGLIETF